MADIPPIEIRIQGFFNEISSDNLDELLQELYEATGIEPHEDFRKGIRLVKNPQTFREESDDIPLFSKPEREALELDFERTKSLGDEPARFIPRIQGNSFNKWHDLPWPLWKLVLLCAVGASVQGWDQAAVNGAQVWYQAPLDLCFSTFCDSSARQRPSIAGLVNSAPYLGCVVSCCFTPWLNNKVGRRGTIFWCAVFSVTFALAQAFVQTWQQLLVIRFLLGLGIGPKSATIPIYAAECAPANIRGSLVMFWQAWTAFGVMAGSVSGVVFQNLGDVSSDTICPWGDRLKLLSWQCSQNWRLILASPAILPLILAAYIYGCSESPRWTVAKAHALRIQGRKRRARILYRRAFRALKDMSRHRVLAARDMVSHYFLLQQENEEVIERQDKHPTRPWLFHQLAELFFDRRNGRAILASSVCMFAQQFCGVNFIIYYSNIIFLGNPSNDSTRTPKALQGTRDALLFTMGFGIINLLLATPAFFTIDTVGRRALLLGTFPLLTISHVFTAIGIAANSRPVELLGMYMFGVFYSFGEGPIPFVYASESMPLHIRVKGMAFVTSINWLFCWFIAFSGPNFLHAFGAAGTFAWYAAWCLILWFIILLLAPETRLLTLEQLDYVFREISIIQFASHAWRSLLWRLHIINDENKPGRLYERTREQDDQPSALLGRSMDADKVTSEETTVEHKEDK